VTDETDVQGLYDRAVVEHGRIDVAVNNAGLGGSARITEMTDEQWSTVLDVTLTGPSLCPGGHAAHAGPAVGGHRQQRLGPRLAGPGRAGPLRGGQGRGHGPHPVRRRRGGGGRGAGERGLAQPGSPPFLNRVMSDDALDELRHHELFGRGAETWEVANVIVFLASDYSSYMSGEVVSVSSQHP